MSPKWMRLDQPELQFMIWLTIPIALLIFWRHFQKIRSIQQFSGSRLFQQITATIDFRRVRFGLLLQILGYFFLAIAICQPQFGKGIKTRKVRRIDLVIALDLSESMLATDLPPNRLEHAKKIIADLIDRRPSDRIGLVAFASDSFVQSPLTTDHATIKMFLRDLDTETFSFGGTNLGDAIETAEICFPKSEDRQSVIIILSDGESHEPIEIPKSISKKKISIFCVGVASPEKLSPIPIFDDRGKFTDYKRDKRGFVVTTKLDRETLKQISDRSRGRFYRADFSDHLAKKIAKDLSTLRGKTETEIEFTEYENRFQIFLIFAILFLTLERLIKIRRSGRSH